MPLQWRVERSMELFCWLPAEEPLWFSIIISGRF